MSITFYFTRPHALQRRREGIMGPFIDLYAARLFEQGFSQESGKHHLKLASDFSAWCERQGFGLPDINEAAFDQFFKHRRDSLLADKGDQSALTRLLLFLRKIEVAPLPVPVALTPAEQVQKDFGEYLIREAGLSPLSVNRYLPFVRRFLAKHFGNGAVRWEAISAANVMDFMRCHAREHSPRHAQLMGTALRSFFKYLHCRGDIIVDLAVSVPSVPSWKLSILPTYLSAEQVRLVLRFCDRKSAIGKRDYATLLLLAQLGLRSSEILDLRLDDIDWHKGQIAIHGKGGQNNSLPLLEDVGAAIAVYLQTGRPCSTDRHVFLRHLAPHTGLKSTSVFWIVRTALIRANIPTAGKNPHLFRHTLATQMLRQGASLAEISQVLRHRHPDTTRIYAKVDIKALRTLALPWMGGVR